MKNASSTSSGKDDCPKVGVAIHALRTSAHAAVRSQRHPHSRGVATSLTAHGAEHRWHSLLVRTSGPSAHVLDSFGLEGATARPQPGGQGDAWRAAGVVLKPVDDVDAAAWTAQVLADLEERGFRISRPVSAVDGGFVVDGWTAWSLVEGTHDLTRRWPEVIRTGKKLNEALAGAPRPPFLDRRVDVWAVGDRVAWDAQPFDVHDPGLRALAVRLRRYLRPSSEPSQLIHGDLSGNVLFHEGLAPAVIDFTPYWRPALFSLAVVAVDAISWYGANGTLFEALPDHPDRASMLARAGIYRLVTSDRAAMFKPESVRAAYLADNIASFARLLTHLAEWCSEIDDQG